MKQNTFEPCKDHESGHFNWCLLCEIEQLRKRIETLESDLGCFTTHNLTATITEKPWHGVDNPVHDIVNGWCK